MHTQNYYRVRLAVRIAFWTAVTYGVFYLVNHVWWTGDTYCWGTMRKCVGL